MACTLKARSTSVSTTGPCGTSIATWICDASAPLAATSQAAISAPLTAVLEDSLGDLSTIRVREEHMMALRRPIDADVPLSLIGHIFPQFEPTSHRDLRRSLYWRSESRTQVRRGLPTGHRSRPIRRGTCPPPGGRGHRGRLVA